MALPKGKKRRPATQAEKDKARQNGETIPTYVIVDIASSGGGSSDCSPTPSSSSYSSSDSGGGSCDGGGSF